MRLITAKPLENAKMNSSNVTTCGYAGSDMVGILDKSNCSSKGDKTGLGTGTLASIYETYIEPDFDKNTSDGKTHVLPYQNLLTTAVNTGYTNRFGSTSGASSNWDWYTRKLDLMSEMNVYGGIVASSSIFDTGIDNRQYAIFRLKPELMYSYNGERFNVNWWLKDVASSTTFANVSIYSNPRAGDANDSNGVRPRFLIG